MPNQKCNHHTIRFPFWLTGQQPEHWGYHGFELSCEDKQTVLELPWNVKLFVKRIDYKAKRIQLYDPQGCLPLQLPNLNLSASPFQYLRQTPFSFNYAESKRTLLNISETAVYEEMLYYQTGDVHLSWSQPDCSKCEEVLNNFKATGEEFINEVGSMCRIHHVNVTRLIGFCADGNKRALVYEYMPNGSLEKFIFATRNQSRSLSWENLQDIAIGIAKGIEYLHQSCDQQILHFDIKPHNILLDQNFNTKISDFGLRKLCSKEQSAVFTTAARGTMGYIAPEVLSRNFGKVSYKSDVYSFGMLLLEMVGERKNIDITVGSTSQVYFPEWVYNCLKRGEVLGIRIENEGHAKIARKLTIVGLNLVHPVVPNRPTINEISGSYVGRRSRQFDNATKSLWPCRWSADKCQHP
ncbi:hypothetical protein SLEP1_g53647 [Rubroshorea leprosula]|uniref:Protein kinase domain-containing protein n=1 Tax=Rubroshorea leprosula TaxID=152421 RepID=A0AAV5M9Y1_9ROSI|nr:hypothetical protein SLEP1_g53647 [Rubroshorea leprosula]